MVIRLKKSWVFPRHFFNGVSCKLCKPWITVLYIPILVLRVNAGAIASKTMPEVQVLVIILSIIVTLCIDATVVTAATTWYLLNKEKTGEK